MQIFNHTITILLILLHLLPLLLYSLDTQEKNLVVQQENDVTKNSSTYATWMWRIKNPRHMGCWRRPWICRHDDSPRIRRRCCRNHCVDVNSDLNNCGLCGIRCPFTWQCCRGICMNTNVNPFHCGKCDRRCPRRSFCSYGMCGYAQPLHPFPFPFPPRLRPMPSPPKPYPSLVA
ncbi:hypothetical protein PHJA_000720900 [Phtheirospermum japonicum]|uniref:Stigma-specific Stig1 family protein n=1 Tax=Phtheirospermum japonicum TaxID=374723 RepID=A0A830BHW9_9LAMI|nr:hypothetical protein PHJA_000720900 [Phtheirospermum japonicum]